MRRFAALILITLSLAACSDRGLKNLRHEGNGPNEFMIAPVKPLAEPGNYSQLPVPTPGQVNLAERSAISEGIVALGGNPAALAGDVSSGDAALVQYANRMGTLVDVRRTLAAEDSKFRKRKSWFTGIRLFPVDRYNQAYKGQSLDAQAEAARWRNAGARTPSSPPAGGINLF